MISIYHNIVWSKYKGSVFSAIHRINESATDLFYIDITQIAETDNDRIGISKVDLRYHNYPFKLLFKGSYSDINKLKLIQTLFLDVYRSSSCLILLPGFHTAEFWAMLLAAKIRRKAVGVFCDSTAYDRPRSAIKGLFKRIFLSQCDVFFCYGERSRDYLKMYGAEQSNIYFRCQAAALPHGYDSTSVVDKRVELAPSKDSPRFLYVGRLSPEKGLDTQLNAFALVLQKIRNAKLVVVGSGPAKESLQALTARMGLTAGVEFLGSKDVDSLRDEYLRATCLVLPSTSEPWGLVVNEALSYGCPVVVSNRCGCVPELVIDGVTGYSFAASDEVDLAEKMMVLVDQFSDTRLVAENCLNVISVFTPEAAGEQILDGCKATLDRLKING